MPIHTGQDKNGKFYQWGKTGKKYYFKPGDEASRKRARGKAEAQQTAIYSSGWKGDKKTMKLIKVKKGDDAKSVKEVEKDLNDVALTISDAAQKLRTIKFAENFLTPEERKYIVSVIMGSKKELTRTTEAYEQLVNDVKKWSIK